MGGGQQWIVWAQTSNGLYGTLSGEQRIVCGRLASNGLYGAPPGTAADCMELLLAQQRTVSCMQLLLAQHSTQRTVYGRMVGYGRLASSAAPAQWIVNCHPADERCSDHAPILSIVHISRYSPPTASRPVGGQPSARLTGPGCQRPQRSSRLLSTQYATTGTIDTTRTVPVP